MLLCLVHTIHNNRGLFKKNYRIEVAKKLTSEFIGTAFLLAAVVGSGIMAERLSAGNVSLALLENTLATGAALVALILTFGPISGAHFNPAVTIADATQHGISWRMVPGYIAAQCAGAMVGVWAAHLMFGVVLGALAAYGPARALYGKEARLSAAA